MNSRTHIKNTDKKHKHIVFISTKLSRISYEFSHNITSRIFHEEFTKSLKLNCSKSATNTEHANKMDRKKPHHTQKKIIDIHQ